MAYIVGTRCARCGVRIPEGAEIRVPVRGRARILCPRHAPAHLVAQKDRSLSGTPKRGIAADGRVYAPYDKRHVPLLQALPGSRWDPKALCWRVSLRPEDRLRVLEVAEQLKLEVDPSLKRWDEGPAVPAVARAVKAKLYPYQQAGVRWLAQRTHALLGDEMGLGKTVQVLMAIPENTGALVVCPATLKFNWRDECRRWRPDLHPTVVQGRENFRMPFRGEVLIVNYDALPEVEIDIPKANTPPEEEERRRHQQRAKLAPYIIPAKHTVLVCDEAHGLAHPEAKRTRRIMALSSVTQRAWFLTGTPLLGRPLDLWGVLAAGQMTDEVFSGWEGFVKDFQGVKGRWGYTFHEPLPAVPEKLRRVMLRRLKKDVLPTLPPKVYQNLEVEIELPTDEEGRLDDIYAQWAEALDAGTMPPFEEISSYRRVLADAKIPALLDLVETYEDAETPILVFSAHTGPVDAFVGREGWEVIYGEVTSAEKRKQVVDDFQAGKLKGLALTIRAGGTGLTLTRASTAIFVDLDWTPALNVQAEDRMHRIGQAAESVQIVRLVADHPLDKRVMEILSTKSSLFRQTVDAKVSAPGVGTSSVFLPKAPPGPLPPIKRREDALLLAQQIRQRLALRRREFPKRPKGRLATGVVGMLDRLLQPDLTRLSLEDLAHWLGGAWIFGQQMQGRWDEVRRQAAR